MQAIVLAGGMGTRLRSKVPDLPKPMAPISGAPFLEYLLEYWINQGVKEFILSVGYKHKIVQDYFGSQFRSAKISYVVEASPLGTGGGFLMAADKIQKNSHFLLLNGDTYFEIQLSKLLNFSADRAADWCFSVFSSNETSRYLGLDINSDGKINALKSPNNSLECLVNGGVYLINSAALKDIPITRGEPFSLELDLFPLLLSMGSKMYAFEGAGNFIDIGIPSDYLRAHSIIVRT
jgi:D-glycero-alpha-D-manno-heptose 1-phosphate guanylyltransferase